MASKTSCAVFFSMAIIGSRTGVLANNNLFLPGDAFFPTVLTSKDIETLQISKSGERAFKYSSLGGYEGALCGYAGFNNAVIPAIDDEFAKNLAVVYKHIREFQPRQLLERTSEGKTELIETNGVRVLFYPPDFEFPGYHLGLRYNERWVEEAVKFGHRREHLRLCSLISDPDAVERDWRDAAYVPPLRAQVPKVQLQPVPVTEAPIVVEGPVKAIAIKNHTLKELFVGASDGYLTVYVVDSKGIKELVCEEGEWRIRHSE